MSSMATGRSGMVEINTPNVIKSVLFVEDGKQVLSGDAGGMLRRWRVEDGQEVGEPIRAEGAEIFAVALSPDRKWLACGLKRRLYSSDGRTSVRVWNAQSHEKILDIHGHTNSVFSVDISPDSTKLATGGFDNCAFIHDLTTGEKLVGPLEHEGTVVAVRFSPNGDRLASATGHEKDTKSIRVYDTSNGQQLLDIPCRFWHGVSSPLAWSADGRQLYATSHSEVKYFDALSGTLLSKWSVPGRGFSSSITLAQNQKFMVIRAYKSLSFWDTFTHQRIGTVIECSSAIWSMSLSPDDDCITTGEENGKVTFQSLRDVLPSPYLTVNLPFMCMSNAVFESWRKGGLSRAEELLTADIESSGSLPLARALAHRALVRTRSKHWDTAIDDAKQSIVVQPSVIGYVASSVAHLGNGTHESIIRMFDLVFAHGLPSENKFLLLLKAVVLFECGRHDDAISRVGDLLNILGDQVPYSTVRAQMLFLLGNMSMRRGDNKRAIELFRRAQEAIPFQENAYLTVISLIFGWDFERLAPAIQIHLWKAMHIVDHTEVSQSLPIAIETLCEDPSTNEVIGAWDPGLVQKCLTAFESNGDAAFASDNATGAIVQYSTALCLNPSNPAGLLVKRSNVRAMLGLWDDALKDADDAIKADPSSPWGYERKHAALHGLRQYDEAINAFACMMSLIESSPDQDIRWLSRKYVSPSRSEKIIDNIIRSVLKVSPLVLIDVKSGHLCDVPERTNILKSETRFKEMVSSMTKELDNGSIQQMAEEYFQYVTLSHVWGGKEPSFQDVNHAGSVWELDPSLLNDKLRKFCAVVLADGYRWAWSDTCCIDKTNNAVLNQSLTMMYKWYEASAATFVHLVDVDSPSALGDLTSSIWMTRAWTAQELLAAAVIRFYDRNWKPYLDDIQSNHKDSLEIMQELAGGIGIARSAIVAFSPDSLSVREKLRLVSTRTATVEEDVAYSLIGIFNSDIRPHYGEGHVALGHLLEETVSRSGDVTVLAWTGKSSSYNSCLPTTLAVYNQPPDSSPVTNNGDVDMRVAALKISLPPSDAILIHERITRLPPVRFANRRLHLPCIAFQVRKLDIRNSSSSCGVNYCAKVSGIGGVEVQTLSRLPEACKLFLVHPWIRSLRDPLEGFPRGSVEDDEEFDFRMELGSTRVSPLQASTMDKYTRALRLVARLQAPFQALLLQQQPDGEFKRVASERGIVAPGIKHSISFTKDVYIKVVEIL